MERKGHLFAIVWTSAALLAPYTPATARADEPDPLDAYNVVRTSPSTGSTGSMPLGNDDLGVNAWVEPSGDLVLLLGKNDAWSENCRLLKLRGYVLQRWINACGGRGAYPIKFNGTIFTVDMAGFDPDYRQWGGPYWWQNTRLPYWPMLASGDFDLMLPLFRIYEATIPLAKHRTEVCFGHGGAFFPETMCFWGMFTNTNCGRNQAEGDRILLLPAWPDDWNVSFKLHAPQQTTIEGNYRDGRLEHLKVTPEHRKKDVEVVGR